VAKHQRSNGSMAARQNRVTWHIEIGGGMKIIVAA